MEIDWVAGLISSPAALIIVGVVLSGTGLWPLIFREKAPLDPSVNSID